LPRTADCPFRLYTIDTLKKISDVYSPIGLLVLFAPIPIFARITPEQSQEEIVSFCSSTHTYEEHAFDFSLSVPNRKVQISGWFHSSEF